jgi:hypothetical protein
MSDRTASTMVSTFEDSDGRLDATETIQGGCESFGSESLGRQAWLYGWFISILRNTRRIASPSLYVWFGSARSENRRSRSMSEIAVFLSWRIP